MHRRIFLLTTLVVLTLVSCKKDKEQTQIPGDKNKFDGRYTISGTITDATEPKISSPGMKEYHMKTISNTEIEMFSPDLNISGHLISHGGSLSYYSKFSVIVAFDPATNKVVSVRNGYGQPSENGRSAVLDPSGINAWDPVTKNIRIKYWMDEKGVVGHKTSFDETWTYIGAR